MVKMRKLGIHLTPEGMALTKRIEAQMTNKRYTNNPNYIETPLIPTS